MAAKALSVLQPCDVGRCYPLQATFAKWNEGQKDRVKQAATAMQAYKGRPAAGTPSAGDSAAEESALQQAPPEVLVRPVKGKDAQPQELHPSQFFKVKAHRRAAASVSSAAGMLDAASAQTAVVSTGAEQPSPGGPKGFEVRPTLILDVSRHCTTLYHICDAVLPECRVGSRQLPRRS